MADKDLGLALLALGSLMGGYNQGRSRRQGMDLQRQGQEQTQAYRDAQLAQSQQVEARRAAQGERGLALREQEASRPRGLGSAPAEVYAGSSLLREYPDAGTALKELQAQLAELTSGADRGSLRKSEIDDVLQKMNAIRMAEGYRQFHGTQGVLGPQTQQQPMPRQQTAPGMKGGPQKSVQRTGGTGGGGGMVQGLRDSLQGGRPIGQAIQSGMQPNATGAVPMHDPRVAAQAGAEWGQNAPLGENAGELDQGIMSRIGAFYSQFKNAPDRGSFMAGLFGLSKELGLEPPMALQEMLDSFHDQSAVV